MTERDQRPAEELTPAQTEAVRRLLAGARHDEGIPDDVAARLDSAIADMAAGRTGEAPVPEQPAARAAEVIPLRRRRWPQVLVAAAAVTAFGFGMAQIVGNGGAGDNATGGSVADVESVPGPASAPEPGEDAGAPEVAPPPDEGRNAVSDSLARLSQRSLSTLGVKGLGVLRPGTLNRDLQELVPNETGTRTDGPMGYAAARALQCGPYYTVSGGQLFAASYRRHLALVLFHPALDGARLVEIYDCEGANPRQAVRTVTLQTGE